MEEVTVGRKTWPADVEAPKEGGPKGRERDTRSETCGSRQFVEGFIGMRSTSPRVNLLEAGLGICHLGVTLIPQFGNRLNF